MTTTANVQSKQATLHYGQARYLEAGTGHPVILLHGASVLGGADDFRPVIELLSASYRVIAPDFIGWPPGDTREGVQAFPGMTDQMREFQDAIGLKSSHIVGATMGGWIAGLFAYESPNRVDKLVMTGNPGFHGSANNNLAQFEIPDADKARAAIAKVSPMLGADEQEALVQEKLRKLHEPGFADAYSSMMKTMADGKNRSEYNLLRRLPFITSPTLFLLGRGDPSSEHADKLSSLTPGSRSYVIESGAHQVHYENTEEFCRVVAEFLG